MSGFWYDHSSPADGWVIGWPQVEGATLGKSTIFACVETETTIGTRAFPSADSVLIVDACSTHNACAGASAMGSTEGSGTPSTSVCPGTPLKRVAGKNSS